MKTPRELAEHLAALARTHDIALNVVADMKPESAHARANYNPLSQRTVNRVITIAPVSEEATYAVALHEMGHLVAPNGMYGSPMIGSWRDIANQILAEQVAWEWAQATALEWTVTMEQNKQMSLHNYEEWALKLGRAILEHERRRRNAKTTTP